LAGLLERKTEAVMPEQSSAHFYLNWAKERIDEMDATLASLEAKASQVQADSKVKANQLIADLQKRRDQFQATVKKQAEAGEAAWERTKTQLESNWSDFETQVKTYIETVGKQVSPMGPRPCRSPCRGFRQPLPGRLLVPQPPSHESRCNRRI
jgi:hypothetical protein